MRGEPAECTVECMLHCFNAPMLQFSEPPSPNGVPTRLRRNLAMPSVAPAPPLQLYPFLHEPFARRAARSSMWAVASSLGEHTRLLIPLASSPQV